MADVNRQDRTLHYLGERIKELTALHRTARILQDDERPIAEVISDIVALLPGAWQYPEITSARITIGPDHYATPDFAESAWMQTATFSTRFGNSGRIEIAYREARPDEAEGPFLTEERDLIDSLAEMLRSYLQHKSADQELRRAHDSLEEQVRNRTAELHDANRALKQQIEQYRRAQDEIGQYQRQLQQLAAELSLAEERHRREIATDLHDHIGQALAYIRMKLTQLRGNAVFSGLEADIDSIVSLLARTIQYTRSLTFEISPPVLYELGLGAAIEWLCEQAQERYEYGVKMKIENISRPVPDQLRVVLFRAVQELLINAAKYSQAKEVSVSLHCREERLQIEVADNGIGFDPAALERSDTGHTGRTGFGLFSIRERLRFLGGDFMLDSAPGRGTRVTLTGFIPECERTNDGG